MKENNQRNTRKKLNALILLVAFTAILLIVSTYAWFSTQRTVKISNLEGIVKVAEGLEISLDGSSWSQEVDFSKYNHDGDQSSLLRLYGETNHNIVPTEMLPVSTNGTEAITGTKLEIPFYRGTNTNTKELGGVVQTSLTKGDDGDSQPTTASDDTYPGYYAIDLFLRNSGIKDEDVQGTTKETLQLTTGSSVAVKAAGLSTTGLQNTPRVAFALYDGVADVNSTGTPVITGTVTDSTKITDIAMWEPNANSHVDYVVQNYNDITWKTGEAAKYIADTTTFKYTATEIIPTYALTAGSIGKTFKNLYNWSGTATGDPTEADAVATLSKQIALQTQTLSTDGGEEDPTDGIRNLISVNSPEDSIATVGQSGKATEFQILKNTVVRLRMYLWLEGQDPDCVNYASHGGGLKLNIGLCKGEEAINATKTQAPTA